MQKNDFDKIYVKIIYLDRPGALGTCIKQECLIGHLQCPRPGGRIPFSVSLQVSSAPPFAMR